MAGHRPEPIKPSRDTIFFPITRDEYFLLENWDNPHAALVSPDSWESKKFLDMDEIYQHIQTPLGHPGPIPSRRDPPTVPSYTSLNGAYRLLRAICTTPVLLVHTHVQACETSCPHEWHQTGIVSGTEVTEPSSLCGMFIPGQFLETLYVLKKTGEPSGLSLYPELVKWILLSEIASELLAINVPIDAWEYSTNSPDLAAIIQIFLLLGARAFQNDYSPVSGTRLREMLVTARAPVELLPQIERPAILYWLTRIAKRIGPVGINQTLLLGYYVQTLVLGVYEPHFGLLWPHRSKFHTLFDEMKLGKDTPLLPPTTGQNRSTFGILYAELYAQLYGLYARDYRVSKGIVHPTNPDEYRVQEIVHQLFSSPTEGPGIVPVILLKDQYHVNTLRTLLRADGLYGSSAMELVSVQANYYYKTAAEQLPSRRNQKKRNQPITYRLFINDFVKYIRTHITSRSNNLQYLDPSSTLLTVLFAPLFPTETDLLTITWDVHSDMG